jgi:hypothetical protein
MSPDILYCLQRYKGRAENAGVPSKVHTRQLVKIQPEERLATISELNLHTQSGNRMM